MTYDELITLLSDGLPAEETEALKRITNRETVKSRAAGLKQQAEYDTLQSRAQALQAELDGGPDKPGAKAYAKWYAENFAAVQKLQADNQKFIEKHGTLEAPKTPDPTPPAGGGLSQADIERLLDQRFQSTFAPNIADVLKKTGTLVQKHLYAKRTNPIDFDAIDKIMGDKKIPLEAAYDEWDKPNREADQKAATDAEVKRRVDEELQKRGSLPSGGTDYSSREPGPLQSKSSGEKFDRNALDRELAETFMRGSEKVQ